jgi:16S rRNA (cytosine967-C5)-methyltransferase
VKVAARDRAGLASRRAALEILLRVETKSAYADVLLGNRLAAFDQVDRGFITRLVLGAIAWRGRIDYELKTLSSRAPDSLHPALLGLLRLGLFQIRFLDRVPPHAIVDTAVELAQENPSTRRADGMVNAILRRALRQSVPLPDRVRDPAGFLAIAYSHPRWMVECFIEWFGATEAETLLAADNEPAPSAIRLNLAFASRAEILERLRGEGFDCVPDSCLPECAILNGPVRFDSIGYRSGLFHAQSQASQFVARLLAPATGSTVVDCAAAPGGKTTHLAELVGSNGCVVAIDRSRAGLRKARVVATRLRHRNIALVCADLESSLPLAQTSAGYVLVDAPCSGLGTLREHPEIRWRLRPVDITRLAAIQSTILAQAARVVRPGGALVYSVCSLAPAEGEEVVRSFLERHSSFQLDSLADSGRQIALPLDADGVMRTRPDRGGLDGFFAARLIRATL